MPEQAFCVHGHFYQPPREDPLTGRIPVESGAAPYKNWNERINAQCYRPNAQLGNFERISFNVGPTLFSWLKSADPETYSSIIAQERQNYERFGVGNGMAQAFNHTILPLASLPDKITQVRWGIADFVYHYGHKPAGMWLPETAVDNQTLSAIAGEGIEFTILAPWQAPPGVKDFTHPWLVEPAQDRKIAVFFYNQALSTRVSFDPGATVNADQFLLEAVQPELNNNGRKPMENRLVMIASDGELYGHHQPFRDKFLAYLTKEGLRRKAFTTSYPGLWLKNYPAREVTAIRQRTSWSCMHGVTRWMGACSCTPNSGWKGYLRKAFDKLGELIDAQYLNYFRPFLDDPWELRHRYASVLLGQENEEHLFSTLAGRPPNGEELRTIKLLLAAQYERQRMFTSCGWFFDDFDRIEPRNNVAYAAQAVWLTSEATGVDLSVQAASLLKRVKSWRTGVSADKIFNACLLRARSRES